MSVIDYRAAVPPACRHARVEGPARLPCRVPPARGGTRGGRTHARASHVAPWTPGTCRLLRSLPEVKRHEGLQTGSPGGRTVAGMGCGDGGVLRADREALRGRGARSGGRAGEGGSGCRVCPARGAAVGQPARGRCSVTLVAEGAGDSLGGAAILKRGAVLLASRAPISAPRRSRTSARCLALCSVHLLALADMVSARAHRGRHHGGALFAPRASSARPWPPGPIARSGAFLRRGGRLQAVS